MLQPRIRLNASSVKVLQAQLNQAYARGDLRLVRQVSVLLGYLVHGLSLNDLLTEWNVSAAGVYQWVRDYLTQGWASLVSHYHGGRQSKLTPNQKARLCELVDAGPQAAGFEAGFEAGCWTALLIQELIRREFGVLYNRFYVCELLRNLGYSFQKARFVSEHLDETRRQTWRTQEWPAIRQAAQQCGALVLFGDEASFPQWGTLSYTWARQGQQPCVKTSGKRKGYKVFGLIEYFSGRFFHAALEGRFESQSYQTFLLSVLAQTQGPLFLIQDGAKYHTSKATREFFAAHTDRLTVFQLPSYSPDYNPIEYLWRRVKQRATHDRYFAQFAELIASVDSALAHFTHHPELVRTLFGLYTHETGLAALPVAP